MTTRDQCVEAVARALCKEMGLDPDGPGPQVQGERIRPNFHMHVGLATAAISTLEAIGVLSFEDAREKTG